LQQTALHIEFLPKILTASDRAIFPVIAIFRFAAGKTAILLFIFSGRFTFY
jgi:hypothetical protein